MRRFSCQFYISRFEDTLHTYALQGHEVSSEAKKSTGLCRGLSHLAYRSIMDNIQDTLGTLIL